MNVLLVDDEPTIRKMMKAMLQSRGFRIIDAGSGADALALSQQYPIDLLVTDVVMGDMDGATLAHSLVERNPNLPVLFISGYPMDFEKERRLYARSNFLPKPFQASELIHAVRDLTRPAD